MIGKCGRLREDCVRLIEAAGGQGKGAGDCERQREVKGSVREAAGGCGIPREGCERLREAKGRMWKAAGGCGRSREGCGRLWEAMGGVVEVCEWMVCKQIGSALASMLHLTWLSPSCTYRIVQTNLG